jgi:hypothetical protein
LGRFAVPASAHGSASRKTRPYPSSPKYDNLNFELKQ